MVGTDKRLEDKPEARPRSGLRKALWLAILIAWIVMMAGFAVEIPRYVHFVP